MGFFKRAGEFVILVNIVALAACSSGGGGNLASAGNTNTGNTNTGNTNTGNTNTGNTNTGNTNTGNGNTDTASNTPVPAVSIVVPALTVSGMVATTHASFSDPLASPAFSMHGDAVAVTQTSVSDPGLVVNGTLQNLGGAGGERVSLSIPALGLANVLLQADGTVRSLADGSTANAALAHTDYMALGAWSYTPANGTQAYLGQIVFGYSTAASDVPTVGTATYTGTAGAATGVHGAYAVPSGTGTILGGTLSGDVSMTVDFANNTASGAFTNMVATSTQGAALPWNNIALSGKLQRDTVGSSVSGVTRAGVPPNANVASFSSGASGSFTSAFFGPGAKELGGSWSVFDAPSSGGKAAYGTFGAGK